MSDDMAQQIASPWRRSGDAASFQAALANVIVEWTLRENVRAQLRMLVKRILREYGYPVDRQERMTGTVLEQAALLSAEWAVP